MLAGRISPKISPCTDEIAVDDLRIAVGDEVARPDDVLRAAAELGERAERDLPAAAGLRGRVHVLTWPSALIGAVPETAI